MSKKKRCCIAKINCVGNKCLKRLTQCKWGGALRCKNFTYNCKLQTRKNKTKRMRCCKNEKVCADKVCKLKTVWCRWNGPVHIHKSHKKCQMLLIKKT